MTTPLYEIETSEGDDGSRHPVEQLWTPCADDAADSGFVAHRGLYVTGIDDPTEDHLYPVAFLVLGHQRWADAIEAAAAYMSRTHGWRNLHLYPGDDPAVLIPRIPRAVHTHGVFLRHPHPDQGGCGCEWDETWRMVWAPATEPGAVPITTMRHPAAEVTAAGIPNPDDGAPATWAA
ncbi:hypothetical protein AB0D14_33945 [Streptomyces sp. NPDC048484]|uniref:hypothetical protein n=1 Tax=Streptomyces sp. NPDC048484 TaxID=3155146 RepID=UPI003445BA01